MDVSLCTCLVVCSNFSHVYLQENRANTRFSDWELGVPAHLLINPEKEWGLGVPAHLLINPEKDNSPQNLWSWLHSRTDRSIWLGHWSHRWLWKGKSHRQAFSWRSSAYCCDKCPPSLARIHILTPDGKTTNMWSDHKPQAFRKNTQVRTASDDWGRWNLLGVRSAQVNTLIWKWWRAEMDRPCAWHFCHFRGPSRLSPPPSWSSHPDQGPGAELHHTPLPYPMENHQQS